MKMFCSFKTVFGSFQNPFTINIFNLFVSFCAQMFVTLHPEKQSKALFCLSVFDI